MTVDASKLELELAALRAGTLRPHEGVFGPGSSVWRVNREAVVFLGAGRAALLQIAHPFVGHAVDEHSASRTDPWGRLVRTFDHVFTMVFSDLDRAIASSRRVHHIHESIHGVIEHAVGPFAAGTRYSANAEEAVAWVAATLWDTSLLVYESVVGPLSPEERDRYCGEARRFSSLFGLSVDTVPSTYAEFQRYMDRMLAPGSALAVDDVSRNLAHDLMRPPSRWLMPVWQTYTRATACWLPKHLREGFGLHAGPVDRAALRTILALARQVRPRLPPSLRYLPAYNEAAARLALAEESVLVRKLTQTWRSLVKQARQPRRERGKRSAAPAGNA